MLSDRIISLLKNITPAITPVCLIIPVSTHRRLGVSHKIASSGWPWLQSPKTRQGLRIPCQAHTHCCWQEVSAPCPEGLSIGPLRAQLYPAQVIRGCERTPKRSHNPFITQPQEWHLIPSVVFYSLESSH